MARQPKILLTGAEGQVGWELRRTLAPLGQVVAIDQQQLDLADPDAIRRMVREVKPALMVNPAAYTAVDKAESEPQLAMAVNGIAPGVLAEEAKRLDAALVHYSTDYVFDGSQAAPYTEADAVNPLCVYGKTKLAGERAIQAVGGRYLIFRTSWVYGLRGNNFLLTMLRLAKERDILRVVADQIGAPTWCRMLAEITALAVGNTLRTDGWPAVSGIYHLTCGGQTSWHGFAQAILHGSGKIIEPISTDQYPTPARRPANSVLDNAKLGQTFGLAMPDWRDALAMAMDDPLTCHDLASLSSKARLRSTPQR